ncbi:MULTISPECIES: monovalent cation/H+ antiporter complex subunit F [Micromonospora]|uniref:Pesticidal protein Cry26Aa n=1 Tax=Micromonospora solifontis TaxID=2487138 RepID=A0ABX9WB90_9ACTN|nr:MULTISPECIES: monovalent cation/H+ antiporter complex subunit F [Micromonospora]NES12811.1 pesticidal protein Cry26Aa [Micromonospora sp. PPF5-17B]NES38917.1 pesticidal protein Cry26Aa [Micromonospora solifontis]NES54736.1 pesticidal protein Cry26Aa [Micromonospora sp. PPF5-6]RNL92590.1 pesticidal protein Cry26Aa [Micromonospora solifontis]
MLLLDIVLGALALSMIMVIVRLVAGPTDADRAAALDLAFVHVIAAVAVLAARLELPAVLDLVLVGTLVGFLATVSLARLLDRPRS